MGRWDHGWQNNRERCALIFTETCLHHNISDQAAELSGRTEFWADGEQDQQIRTLCLHHWCLVPVKADGQCLPDVEPYYDLTWKKNELCVYLFAYK